MNRSCLLVGALWMTTGCQFITGLAVLETESTHADGGGGTGAGEGGEAATGGDGGDGGQGGSLCDGLGSLVHATVDGSDNTLGESWAAAAQLPRALEVAAICPGVTEVWVASGVHRLASSRESFVLPAGVAVLGGFVGDETEVTARAWTDNPTVLSADVAGDDSVDARGVVLSPDDQVGSDNAPMLVDASAASGARLDGFILTATAADGTGSACYVGGADVTLDNLEVWGNASSGNGAGVLVEGGTAGIGNVRFAHNAAVEGGAVFSDMGTLDLREVTFEGNEATQGGAMRTTGSTVTATMVHARSNTAQMSGGAFYLDGTSHCTGCMLRGNTAIGPGGGIALVEGMHTLDSSVMSGNVATLGGGVHLGPDTTLDASFITSNGNFATSGGGMHVAFGGTATVSGSIFWDNVATGASTLVGTSIHNEGSTAFDHSLVQHSGGSTAWDPDAGTDAGDNLDAHPRFVEPIDPQNAPDAGGDHHLLGTSHAINAGPETVAVSSVDAEGLPREIYGRADAGAHEVQGDCTATVVYVDASMRNHGDGSSWAAAFPRLQRAFLHEALCATNVTAAYVKEGIYVAGTLRDDRIEVPATSTLAVYGSFAGTESNPGERVFDITSPTSIFSGDVDGDDTTDNGVTLAASDIVGGNTRQLMTIAAGAAPTFDGFTFTGGQAEQDGMSPDRGGAVFLEGTVTFDNVRFVGNTARHGGAVHGDTYTMRQVRFERNHADDRGGAIDGAPATGTSLTDVRFEGNTANRGGAIYNDLSTSGEMTLIRAAFEANEATNDHGGAIHNAVFLTMTDVSFVGNRADRGGGVYTRNQGHVVWTNGLAMGNLAERAGALYIHDDDLVDTIVTLINVTVHGNYATDFAGTGGIYKGQDGFLSMRNCILQGNGSANFNDYYSQIFSLVDGTPRASASHTLIEGATWPTTEITDLGNNVTTLATFAAPVAQPHLNPTTAGDAHLASGSAGIDAGNNTSIDGITEDLAGNPRIVGGVVDLGCYESP